MAKSLQFPLLFTILLFSVGVATADHASELYWGGMLPKTPMPKVVMDALRLEGNGDVWAATHTKIHHWTHSDETMLLSYEGQAGHCHQDLMKQNMDFVKTKFFLAKDLSIGTSLNVQFKDGGIYTRFPSPRLSQQMPPFKADSLLENLHFFNAKPGSEAAMVMNLTLNRCEHPDAIDGNSQFCATSLENLVSYVTSTLGGSNNVRTATASPKESTSNAPLPHKVVNITQLATEKNMVACHRLGFPYAVYYCHQPKHTMLNSISLVGMKDGTFTKAFAICHSKTSEWGPNYVGFKTLGVKPGTPICHFLQFHDLVWYRG